MIAPNNPSVSVDELMTKINEQIAGSRAASLLDSEGVRSLTADTSKCSVDDMRGRRVQQHGHRDDNDSQHC